MATPDTMSVDLETASREEIIAQLEKRYGQMLLVTTRPSKGEVGNENQEVEVTFRGGFYACWGLARAADRRFVTSEDEFWNASDEVS